MKSSLQTLTHVVVATDVRGVLVIGETHRLDRRWGAQLKGEMTVIVALSRAGHSRLNHFHVLKGTDVHLHSPVKLLEPWATDSGSSKELKFRL
jgi:hypothetical protein